MSRTWAAETHQLAVDMTYRLLPTPLVCNAPPSSSVLIDRAYAEATAPVIRGQLARAVVRLAAALNRALS